MKKVIIIAAVLLAIAAVYILAALNRKWFPFPKKKGGKDAYLWTPRRMRAPKTEESMEFISMQYNIFGRPYTVSHDGQRERIKAIPGAIKRMVISKVGAPDVISFCELDNEDDRQGMLAQFRSIGYPHATEILAGSIVKGSLINGGVVIVSRWPIVKQDQMVYHGACTFADCLAAKGVVYVRIIKEGKKAFNIFATHMQAWPQDKSRGRSDPARIRKQQAKMMANFVKLQQVPAKEPVIFQGDFNTDMVLFPNEVLELIDTLSAHKPNLTTKNWGQRFSSDPTSNILVGRDGGAGSAQPAFPGGCEDLYEKGWGAKQGKTYTESASNRLPYKNIPGGTINPPNGPFLNFFVGDTGDPLGPSRPGSRMYFSSPAAGNIQNSPVAYCPCCPTEFYDLILASRQYQAPTSSSLEICPLKSDKLIKVPWEGKMQPVAEPAFVGAYMQLYDLSDHYPVVGHFTFPVLSGPIFIPDGCKQDSDCHYDAWNVDCKCTGGGCTYRQKPMKAKTGWFANRPQDGKDHPLNKNCKYAGTAKNTCVCRAGGVF